jgi:F-type H+-transporting ATPase subunit gamma
MPSLKEIRNRITSVKKTQKTTSAMKMVSAAKLNRAEDTVRQAQPYSKKLKHVVSSLGGRFTEEDHPIFRNQAGDRVAVILLTSDRGLCGGFNANLCKALSANLDELGVEQAQMYVIGRKGRDYFRRTSHSIVTDFPDVHPSRHLEIVHEVVDELSQQFIDGKLDRVFLVYNEFVSVLTQKPTVDTLLPIIPPSASEETVVDEREAIFEPSAEEILEPLLRQYIRNQMYTAWLSTIAGEHAARMTAMDSATKNAGEMIKQLNLYYNRTRQAAITKELIEIISGAESL